MNISLVILILLFIIFLLFFYSLKNYLRYKKLLNKYLKTKSDVSRILIAVKRARYGDITYRVDKLNNEELELYINRLLETIYDREMMIKEYQLTLSNKNLSLEEIIKNENKLKQFKEEFAATLTHDLKVPVVAELNSINFLLEGRFGEINNKQKEILNLMKSSNEEQKELIENILETYKLEQHGLKLNFSLVNLNDFLLSIHREMQPIAIKSFHKIVLNIEKTKDFEIKTDKFQLKRVIKNLVQNALSFAVNSSEIEIKTNLSDNILSVAISNAGESISADEINLIFDKYYSGQNKFRKIGTGLGLYISKQIVLAHKCELEAVCKNGYTTFLLKLPITNNEMQR